MGEGEELVIFRAPMRRLTLTAGNLSIASGETGSPSGIVAGAQLSECEPSRIPKKRLLCS
jgi:hypothetical protein